mmetsp:Transcript_33849/g.55906  ORF Transcript_33849/g.55906 Transcript_33849/m.55906 type:complete len:100 (-) Transcript_33849:1300-1599(-)
MIWITNHLCNMNALNCIFAINVSDGMEKTSPKREMTLEVCCDSSSRDSCGTTLGAAPILLQVLHFVEAGCCNCAAFERRPGCAWRVCAVFHEVSSPRTA